MGADIPASQAAGSRSDDELLAAARQEDAGDVAQESLVSMARSVRGFRGDASVSGWLYTIARRFCIKKRRRSKFAPPREESLDEPSTDLARHLADPTPNPEQTTANREL